MSDDLTDPGFKGSRIITGEFRVVPPQEVSPIQRQSNGNGKERAATWLKIVAAVGAALAVAQTMNNLGPCNMGWKFQTSEAAQIEARNNSEEHVAIRGSIEQIASDVKDIQGAMSRIERKLGTRR